MRLLRLMTLVENKLCDVRSECHYPASLRFWDSSSNKFQLATLLKLGTHYPTPLRFGDSSTTEYYCTPLVIFESHYSSLLVLAVAVSVLGVSVFAELSRVSDFSFLAAAPGFFPL